MNFNFSGEFKKEFDGFVTAMLFKKIKNSSRNR